MNKILNILFFIGLFLFLFVALNSFGGNSSIDIFLFYDPYLHLRTEIPYYDFATVIVAVISMILLLVVLIGKFKNLPDLRQRSFSYNLLLNDNNFKKFDPTISYPNINDFNFSI